MNFPTDDELLAKLKPKTKWTKQEPPPEQPSAVVFQGMANDPLTIWTVVKYYNGDRDVYDGMCATDNGMLCHLTPLVAKAAWEAGERAVKKRDENKS